MITALIISFGLPPLWAVFASLSIRVHTWTWRFWCYVGISAAGGLGVAVFGWPFYHTYMWYWPGYLFWIVGSIWYFTRKRRERAAKLLGAKSRALRDALVRKAR